MDSRHKEARFPQRYLMFGTTSLVAANNAAKHTSFVYIDKKGVEIDVNFGGTNEKIVKTNINDAGVIPYDLNLAIPKAIAAQEVDVMIVDSVEAFIMRL